jgi:hypothetical protein
VATVLGGSGLTLVNDRPIIVDGREIGRISERYQVDQYRRTL